MKIRLISSALAVAMIFSMFTSASAIYPENIDPFDPVGTVTYNQLQDIISSSHTRISNGGDVLIPYNNGSGTTGTSVAYFEADTEYLYFALRLKPGEGWTGSTYHIQLYELKADGSSSKKGREATYHFGEGPIYQNLEIKHNYFVKISSQTVDRGGANGEYLYSTEGPVDFD